MPYASHVGVQNRVNAIKKKFEDGESTTAKHDKPVIKRSPAFRVDRAICGKDVSFITPKNKPPCGRNLSDGESKYSKTVVKSRLPHVQKWNSETDINTKVQKNDYNVRLISKESDLLGEGSTKPLSAEYAVVDKTKNCDAPVVKELINDDSVRLALLSPLPTGPPPKKPPRLFAQPPVTPKDDARLKLEKIENFIKIKEQTRHVITPRKIEEKKIVSKQDDACGLAGLSCLSHGGDSDVSYEKSSEKRLECLDLKRLNGPVKSSDKGFSFTTSRVKSPASKSGVSEASSATAPLPFKRSNEPVYALPFKPNGDQLSSFKTFGKSVLPAMTVLKPPPSPKPFKTETALHYMVTDLTKPLRLNWEQTDGLKVRTSPPVSSILTNSNGKELLGSTSPNLQPSPPKPSAVELGPSTVRDMKIIMNQAFGTPIIKIDGPGLESDETSGTSSSEDSLSLETTPDEDASSPSLNADRTTRSNNLLQLTEQRKVYVRRVSSHVASSNYYLAHRDRLCNSPPPSTLFESCLLVGLTLADTPDGQKKNLPYVKSFFPPHVQPPAHIESFCFPDAESWPPPRESQEPEEQYYSIVLTDDRGDRKFGYCRRVLPEGGHFCLPLAYCIISPHRASGFYYKVLQELESRHGSPDQDSFMKLLYECEFPNPGQNLKFTKILERVAQYSKLDDIAPSTLVRRPPDTRLEERDVSLLLNHLTIPVFLKVFSSLLLERKVLLLGKSLSTLSGCIEGLQSILYPFSWQHSYVPVLPAHMLEFCDAPTPYVIGVLKQPGPFEANLKERFTEEGIMVDVEDSRIIKCCKDEGSILPSKFIKSLKTALSLAMTPTNKLTDYQRNVLVSEAFIRFFVEVSGHYSRFVTSQPDGTKIFEKEQFIKEMQSSNTQSFLEWFTETAMFNLFIQERLQYDVQDLFRKRSNEHFDEMEKNSALLHKNQKGNTKKGKTFGDRIKDLTSFSK